jgi:hypothetical protein
MPGEGPMRRREFLRALAGVAASPLGIEISATMLATADDVIE